MENGRIKTAFLIFILIILFASCNEAAKKNEDVTTVTVDSTRNIALMIPDSIKNIDVEQTQSAIKILLEERERFNIDTISTLSPRSIAMDARVQALRQRLVKVLPKISLKSKDNIIRNYYIVEGDIRVDYEELRLYCLKRLQKTDTSIAEKIQSNKLTVAEGRNGEAAVWPKGSTIKYCVMRSSFSSKAAYESVVSQMKNATSEWMAICNINFRYIPSLDNKDIDLETFKEPIFFIVRQIDAGGDFIGQSFFPSEPKFKRLLLLDNSFFTTNYNQTGILRHELGHVLGFRHEHIWSSDASCRGENIIQEEMGAHLLTKYDPYSVMHYPCGENTGHTTFELTPFDKAGALKAYPF